MRKRILQSTLILTILSTGLNLNAAEKVYNVPQVEKTPAINGNLNDKCWENTPESGPFQIFKSTQKTSTTKFKICRDSSWLYFGITCQNANMKDVELKNRDYNGPIHEDDSVEIFLDPGTEGRLYYHFLLNFGNIRADRMLTVNKGQDLSWRIPWRSAVQVDKNGWTAEIAVPLSIMINYGDLADAKFNICRNQVNPIYDTMGLKVYQKREWSSWSPVKNRFHEPESFGQLKELENINPESPFLPAIEKAEVKEYQLDQSGSFYEISGTIRTYNKVSGEVELEVKDKPVSGKSSVIKNTLKIPGNNISKFSVKVPVADMFQRQVEILLRDINTSELLQKYPIRNTTGLALMQIPVVGKNYYTSEKEATILCRLGCKSDFLSRKQLLIKDSKGNTISQTDQVKSATYITIPIANLAAETHVYEVILLQKNGMKAASKQVSIIKKAPHPGYESKIDQINRVVQINNKPFFPFGIVFTNSGNRNLEKDMQYVADAGFNYVEYWGNWGKDSVKRFIAACDQHGLHNSVYLKHLVKMPFYKNRYKIKENMPNIITGIKQFKEYSRLVSFQTVDEPNLGDYKKNMKQAEELYNQVMKLDDYRPVQLVFARDIPELERTRKCSQILIYDLYLWAGTSLLIANPNYITKHTIRLADICKKANMVPWIMPSSESLDLFRTPRPILPVEQMSQTYLAIIHGAKGIVYFHLTNIYHDDNWKTLGKLSEEIKSIAPALTAPELEQKISYSPIDLVPENSQFPDVQVKLFKDPSGSFLLMAANSRGYPSDTSICIKGLGESGLVKSRFAKTKLKIKNDTFSDRFAPFQTRVYELGKRELPQQVEVAVTAKSYPEKTILKEKVINHLMRKNTRNFFPNGDFTRESLRDWPKFFMPFHMGPQPAIGSKDSPWQLDKQNFKFGKQSLKLKLGDGLCRGFFASVYAPPLQQPTPCVLSLYMKTNQPGHKITLHAPDIGFKGSFVLDKEWKRYSLKGILKPHPTGQRCRNFLFINPPGKKATVWFDGLQFEAGETPTPFTIK
jgi:hypothetical protein